jgi:DNA invertase Pin-like site-specific DNA recombinase
MKITKVPRKRDQHKKRVAAYCRVSTRLDNQEESFETQVSYYTAYILTHAEWEFVGIYSDEKSATKASNRPGFQQMIRDALDGKVDYILVKSISRFSRNIVDCQQYADLLKSRGCYIHFEKEGLDTEDPSSSMMFSFLSVIAQDESRSISDNVRWAYRERYKRGEHNLGSNRVLGYDCVDGKLVPNGDAGLVRSIYQAFLDGRTYTEIADSLNSQGETGLRKKPFSGSGIRYILQNEVYVGDRILQK